MLVSCPDIVKINVHQWHNWRALKAEDVGLGRAVFRGNVEMLPTSDMMRFVCSGGIWTQGTAVHMVFTCLDCLFVHSKPGLLSFYTIFVYYTVQLCMLQGKFQEFKYIVIYCIATLFLTKYCTGTYHNMRSAHWWYDDLMEQSILG